MNVDGGLVERMYELRKPKKMNQSNIVWNRFQQVHIIRPDENGVKKQNLIIFFSNK